MAQGVQFPTAVLANLAGQIGEFVSFGGDETLAAAEALELRESFEVWVLGLDAVLYASRNDLPLARVASPSDLFHHQLAINGDAYAYLRSQNRGTPARPELVVQGLFVADTAGWLDRAITRLDRELPDAGAARLLVVPSTSVQALWVVTERAERVVPLGPTSEAFGFGETTPITPAQFLTSLDRGFAGPGVLLATTTI